LRADLDALIAADGHWDWEQINAAEEAIEPLRLLRWMLRIDIYLPVIGEHLQASYDTACELVEKPEKVYKERDWSTRSKLSTGRTRQISS
jgi:hypothetical protein